MVFLLASPANSDSNNEAQRVSIPSSKVHDSQHPSNITAGCWAEYIISLIIEGLGLETLFNSVRQKQGPNPDLLISKSQLTFSHYCTKCNKNIRITQFIWSLYSTKLDFFFLPSSLYLTLSGSNWVWKAMSTMYLDLIMKNRKLIQALKDLYIKAPFILFSMLISG